MNGSAVWLRPQSKRGERKAQGEPERLQFGGTFAILWRALCCHSVPLFAKRKNRFRLRYPASLGRPGLTRKLSASVPQAFKFLRVGLGLPGIFWDFLGILQVPMGRFAISLRELPRVPQDLKVIPWKSSGVPKESRDFPRNK